MDATDRLIQHLRQCHACIAAKAAGRATSCQTGRELVRLTLKERHGE